MLESGELQRVGSDKLTATDVRVIAATNQDLRQMIEEHRFRDDLYYRLNVCPLFIPPLRERRDEIPILFEYFFNEYRSTSGRPTPPLTSDLAEFLYASYDYPGNIRELKNLSRYLAQVGGASALTLSDLPGTYLEHLSAAPDIDEAGEQAPLMLARASAERDKLLRVLQARHGDVASVCRELSISRSRLYQLFKKHDVNPKTYRRR